MLVLLLTTAACVTSALYFVLIRGIVEVHTHIFYVPIVLAGMWYHKKAVYVALFLGIVFLLAIYFSPLSICTSAVARTAAFIAVAYLIGYISSRRERAEETLRKRTEQVIRHQRTLLELTKLDYSDLESALKGITEMTSKTLGVEQMSVWFFTEDHSAIICEDLYKLSENLHEKGLRLEACDYPRYFQALEDHRAIAANDACTDPRTSELSDGYLKPFSITSMMDVSVRLRGNLVGIVCHEHLGPRKEWTLEEQDFAASIADIVSLTLESSERKRAEEELGESEEKYRSLVESTEDSIYLVDRDCRYLFLNDKYLSRFGLSMDEIRGRTYGELHSEEDTKEFAERVGKAFETGKSVSHEHRSRRDNRYFLRTFSPVKDSKGRITTVTVISKDITERQRAEVALKSSFIQLAETVSRAMEPQDPYTAGHQRRVADMSLWVGAKMGLDEEELRGLYIAGLLHDVGKISIPVVILTYPGKLNEAEWALICSHTRCGYEILKEAQFPWPVAEMALHHHERLDGSGYPDRLKGRELSREVRILAVCDVVEAMFSRRPYRPARSWEEVQEELRRGRGTKYDPEVVDTLFNLWRKTGISSQNKSKKTS